MVSELDPVEIQLDRTVELNRLAAEILASGRAIHFRARGVSMRPCIRDGDLLEIQAVQAKDIRSGDILLINPVQRQLLVHRVTRTHSHKGQPRFLLQGDAVLQPDGWLTPDQVLGRVISIDRNGRRLFLNTPSKHLSAILYSSILNTFKSIYRKFKPSSLH